MGLRKHGLTHWAPRSTGLADELIDHWQVHKKLPPHLAYILWNCSGWMSIIWRQYWHWLGTDRERFKYSMEYFRWIPTKWSRLNKMYQTPVKRSPDLVILFPPSAVYMRRWIGSALIRVMVSRLFGAKPLPEPVLTYNQLDPWERTSVKL